MTNYDVIHEMDVHDLAEILCDIKSGTLDGCDSCPASAYCHIDHNGMRDWLNAECEGQTEDDDDVMTFAEYQELARRTQNKALTPVNKLDHALLGLCSEAGEIAGIYQKEFQGHPIDPAQVIDEIGDLLWFAAELCDCLKETGTINASLEYVARHNVEKLRKRYPEGFDAERSINREKEG